MAAQEAVPTAEPVAEAAAEAAAEPEVVAESAPVAATEEAAETPDSAPATDGAGLDQMIESLGEPQAAAESVAELSEPEAEPEAELEAETAVAEAPEAQPQPQPAVAAVVMPEEAKAANVSLWPFIVYLGAWLVFAGVYVWQFIELPAERAVFDQPVYGLFVAMGIGLAVTGPVVALVTWMTSWGKQDATKSDLLVSALVRGSIVTFGGVSIWWLAYILVDLMRLGRVL